MGKVCSGKWSFWFSGIIIALIFNLGLYLLDEPVGMNDGYLPLSRYFVKILESGKVAAPGGIDWQTWFFSGIVGGALLGSLLSGSWKFEFNPSDIGKEFVPASGKALLQGLAGGFLVMLGLQLANDSFFGHWAAAMQLSIGSWLFLIVFFFTGAVLSIVMSRRNEGGK